MQLNRQERLAAIIVILTLTCGVVALITDPDGETGLEVNSIDDGCPDTSTETGGFLRLDLNSATVEELVALPGIGPKRAQAIINLRSQQGRFRCIEDLLRVRGIGRKTLKLIEPYVFASPDSDTTD